MEVSEEKLDKIRMENERYLRKHKELHEMISKFMNSLLRDKPTEVLPYAIVFFTSQNTDPE